MLVTLAASALAGTPDVPHVWFREAVGVAGFPSGALSDSRVQYRAPLHRSESAVFQQTFAGVGARVAASPAFTAVGPRITLAPIDVLDVDLQASWIGYYGTDGIGLLPFESTDGKLGDARSARGDESITGGAFQLSAAPTLKAKVGPIIAFDAWNFSWTRIAPQHASDAAFVYEPFSDLVVAWTDVTVEQQGAVVLEVVPDEGDRFFWVGATVRDRRALVSKDGSTAAGFMLRGRPNGGAWPTFVEQTLFYVRDADRVGTAPSVALLAEWKLNRELR
jgi:hypothetical protein